MNHEPLPAQGPVDANVRQFPSRDAQWFSLVMNAAAEIEDASNCLRDQDAKRTAQGAAKYYREAANAMFGKHGPNARSEAAALAQVASTDGLCNGG